MVVIIDENDSVKCIDGLTFIMDESGTFHVVHKNKLRLPIRITACGKEDPLLSNRVESVPRAQVCPECIRRSNGGVIPA